jgi:hypothetical protein
MALDDAPGARGDGGARDRSSRALRDVSGDQGSLIVGVADIVVAP